MKGGQKEHQKACWEGYPESPKKRQDQKGRLEFGLCPFDSHPVVEKKQKGASKILAFSQSGPRREANTQTTCSVAMVPGACSSVARGSGSKVNSRGKPQVVLGSRKPGQPMLGRVDPQSKPG